MRTSAAKIWGKGNRHCVEQRNKTKKKQKFNQILIKVNEAHFYRALSISAWVKTETRPLMWTQAVIGDSERPADEKHKHATFRAGSWEGTSDKACAEEADADVTSRPGRRGLALRVKNERAHQKKEKKKQVWKQIGPFFFPCWEIQSSEIVCSPTFAYLKCIFFFYVFV